MKNILFSIDIYLFGYNKPDLMPPRSRSAAPGVRYNKHRDYSWTDARNRTRSSSPHNRYHQSSNYRAIKFGLF